MPSNRCYEKANEKTSSSKFSEFLDICNKKVELSRRKKNLLLNYRSRKYVLCVRSRKSSFGEGKSIVLDREIGLDREEFNWPALTNRERPYSSFKPLCGDS